MAANRWLLTVCLAAPLASLRLNQEQSQAEPKCPSMFATITSRPDNIAHRDQIRDMWRYAGKEWGRIEAKFAVCNAPTLSEAVHNEQKKHGDMLFLDCQEGYLDGMLTRKVLASMKTYLRDYSDRFDLYMKVDDDTFISFRRICNILSWRSDQGRSNARLYMGVFAEGSHESLLGKHFPDRDPSSPWYEPHETFSGDVYPVSAKGGPGYILSRHVVENIVYRGIAERNLLNNEDKGIGVWVDALLQQDIMPVDFVNIPGTDGYAEHAESIITTGTYKQYPHFLHHHLPGSVIHCLNEVDMMHDAEFPIDGCFELLQTHSEDEEAEVAETAAVVHEEEIDSAIED